MILCDTGPLVAAFNATDKDHQRCAAIADDELRVIEATPHDYRRMSELLATYSSARLQAVDSCIVALAERLDLREVATLDRRDFMLVAPCRLLPHSTGSVTLRGHRFIDGVPYVAQKQLALPGQSGTRRRTCRRPVSMRLSAQGPGPSRWTSRSSRCQ